MSLDLQGTGQPQRGAPPATGLVTVQRVLAALALIFALAHVPFLATSLEDIDSVNFALGVRDFDVAAHRPHPPGYPVYIALGKVATAIAGFGVDAPPSVIEAKALAVLSLLAGLPAILCLYGVFAVWRGRSRGDRAVCSLGVSAISRHGRGASCPLFDRGAAGKRSSRHGARADGASLPAAGGSAPAADGDGG